jgi:hypothetical protein
VNVAGLREKIKGEVEKVCGSSIYENLKEEEILKRMIFGGEEEVIRETSLEAWMRIFSMTKEEILTKYPEKFNPDGSFKT